MSAVVLTTALLAPATAQAETAAQAAARVQHLLTSVRAVQADAELAVADYDAAMSGLTRSTLTEVLAQQAAEDQRQVSISAQERVDERARALYVTGGPATLYAAVLLDGRISDLQVAAQLVGRVLASDRASAAAEREGVNAAQLRASAAAAAVSTATATGRVVAAAAVRLDRLLAEQATLLRAAQTAARGLAAAESERALLAARLTAQRAAAAATTTAGVGRAVAVAPPPDFFALYRVGAATCPGLSWTVLAAIGQVESRHGRDTGTSVTGARGPMQFLPATFARYAVDGNADGVLDVLEPSDAIVSAAHYLCANGAGRGPAALAGAIRRYNHADWYVRLVLALAARYRAAAA